MARKNPHAVALGRKGGSATSEAKADAARANGKKGGRPPKSLGGCTVQQKTGSNGMLRESLRTKRTAKAQ